MSLPTTISDALAHGRRAAAASGEALTPSTAQALLAHITGRGRAWLFAHGEEPLNTADAARFVALLERAAAGEPLAHLTGEREFYGLAFSVTPDVLIPRPETEALVDVTLEWAQARALAAPCIVDVGTGSGAIAVALAVKLPQARVVATDISWEALVIARANAQRHGVEGSVGLVLADLLEGLAGPFDAIAANLPYINREELAALEVGRWEPLVALDGGPDGLDMVRRLLEQAPSRLTPGGLLVLEIGSDQGVQAAALCRKAFPLARVSVLPDLAGRQRVIRVDIP